MNTVKGLLVVALLCAGAVGAQDVAAKRPEPSPEARAALEAGLNERSKLNYKGAIEHLTRAIELAPECSEAFFARGTCMLKIGSFMPGILDFSRALEIDPRLTEIVYTKVYQITYVVDLERVIEELDKRVAADPELAHVVFMRGFFFVAKTEFKAFGLEDVERGAADFDACLKLNPKHVAAHLHRGLLHFRHAQLATDEAKRWHGKALDDYQQGLKLYPKSGLSHYFQGMLWAQRMSEQGANPEQAADHKTRALEALGKALELGFRGYDRLKNEPVFDALREDPGFRALLEGK